MDPSSEIRGSWGDELRDKKIGLVVTGSISAYKTPDLIRKLVRHGAEVYVIPSKEALRFITLDALKWASGGRVIEDFTYLAEHIYVVRDLDLILVAPATANIISKAAHGLADTPASLALHSAIGYGKPVLMAPVMHLNMMENPFLKEAMERLAKAGVGFIKPVIEEEKAKLPSIDDIFMEVRRTLSNGILRDTKVLVTAGPTTEYIDPVRVLTNKSSGKMGVYIAEEAYVEGASVKLIAGRIRVEPYRLIDVDYVETTGEMYNQVIKELEKGYDVFISASAPVDYTPVKSMDSKIDTSREKRLNMEFILTPKIVREARKRFPDLFIVSFKAVYGLTDEEMVKAGIKHCRDNGFQLTVVNDVSRPNVGFESDYNEVVVVDGDGRIYYRGRDSKRAIAREILKSIYLKFKAR